MKKNFCIESKESGSQKEALCAVVNAIPNGWAVARGELHATERMFLSGEALRSTKLTFKASIDCMIDRMPESEEGPDVYGILFEGKNPASIKFGELFGNTQVMPMSQIKKTVARFIRLGYRGRVEFIYRMSEDRDPHDFTCQFWLPSRDENETPTITVAFHCADHPAGSGTVAPILKACEEVGLVELQPA